MTDELYLDLRDFDSTLFDLIGFVRALPLAVEAEFGIGAQAFGIEIPHFYVGKIGYDVHAHLAHHGRNLADPVSEKQLLGRILAVHKELTGEDDLLFRDAREELKSRPNTPNRQLAIMSVNLLLGFLFKRQLCGGVLDRVPYRLVGTASGTNKGEVLADEWGTTGPLVFLGTTYVAARVVDDVALQVEAVPDRPDVERIQIFREGQRYPRTKDPAIRVIGLLTELAV